MRVKGVVSYWLRSIGTILVILELILVVMVIEIVGKQAWTQWQDYRAADDILHRNNVIDDLMQAAQNLAFERGRAYVVLSGTAPISAADRQFLDDRRKAADAAFDAARQWVGPWRGAEMTAIEDSYAKLLALRTETDLAFSVPRPRRPAELTNRWLDFQTTLLHQINAQVIVMTQRLDQFTPTFRIYSRFKVLAFDLRDNLGLESSRTAASLAGEDLTPETLAEIMQLRGRASANWVNVQREAQLLGNPALVDALAKVDAAFFQSYRPLEDQVLVNVYFVGQKSPVTLAELTAASIPALESIVQVMQVAGAQSDRYVRQNRFRAGRDMLYRLMEMLLALAISAAALYVIIRRLLLPVHAIQEDLESLAKGGLLSNLTLSSGSDEIGLMRKAVISVRDSLVQRTALEERLKEESIRDPLTGLLNRRYLEETAPIEIARAARAGAPIGLLMLDLDHFKRVNDRLGHDGGDCVLRGVARCLLQHVRGGDLVCRYGGEEFIMLLPNTRLDQVLERGERLRLAVKSLDLQHAGKAIKPISISIGAALYPDHGQTLAAVITAADAALYRAKQTGRDKVLTAL